MFSLVVFYSRQTVLISCFIQFGQISLHYREIRFAIWTNTFQNFDKHTFAELKNYDVAPPLQVEQTSILVAT